MVSMMFLGVPAPVPGCVHSMFGMRIASEGWMAPARRLQDQALECRSSANAWDYVLAYVFFRIP
jgi:hypothetical protein